MDRAAVNDDTWAINISLDIVALDVRRAIGHKSDAVRLHLQRCKLTTVTGLRRRLGRWSVDQQPLHSTDPKVGITVLGHWGMSRL